MGIVVIGLEMGFVTNRIWPGLLCSFESHTFFFFFKDLSDTERQ